MVGDSEPLSKPISNSVKRKMLSMESGHPGHDRVYCPKVGAYRLLRKDDELRAGDGFGGHGGKFVWEEKRAAQGYRNMKVHCTIEGSPLSGKSTLVRNIAEYARARGHPTRVLLEVPDSWQDETGSSLLDKQAENPLLYSLHLQCMILSRRGKMLAERGGYDGLVLQDRYVSVLSIDLIIAIFSSPLASRFVYTEVSKDRGFLSAHDLLLLDTLMEGIEALSSRIGATPSAVVFLCPPIQALLQRLSSRGQVGDEQLNAGVLADLQRRHNDLAGLYINMGFDILLCKADLTPEVYPVFEAEFYHYLR